MTLKTRPRAVLYCRISKGNDRKITDQERWCRQLAEDHDYEVVAVHRDDGISASEFANRPGWIKVGELIEREAVDVVVAVDEDRLTRQPLEKSQFTLLCAAHGVQWHTNQGLTDPATADGEFFSHLRAGLAKMEVRRKSERQRRANLARAQRGLPLSCTRPFGYQSGGLKLHDVEAPELRAAYERVAGGGSLYEVARSFNTRSITTTRGNPWSFATVRQSLLRPRNAGIVVYQGDVLHGVEAQWEALVDRPLFDAVGSILSDPGRLLTSNREQRWLCSGIAKCGVCGSPLRASGSASNRVYRCSSKQVAGAQGRHVSARVEELDDLVRDELIGVFLARPHRSRTTASGELRDVLALRAKLQANLASQQEVTNSLGDPAFNLALLRARSQDLRGEEERLRRQIEAHTRRNARLAMYASSQRHMVVTGVVNMDAAVNASMQLRRNFDRLSLREQRSLVRESLDIVVHHGRGPGRFTIEWK